MTTKERAAAQEAIPTYQGIVDQLCAEFAENHSLAALYINCSKFERVERVFGKKIYQDILRKVHSIIMKMKGSIIRNNDIIASMDSGSDEFLIFLAKKRMDETFYPADMETLCERVTAFLNKEFFPIVIPYLRGKPKITVGYAVVLQNPVMRSERLLNKLIEDAKKMASYQEFRRLMRDKEKLQELILKESIRTLFQPIVDITTNKIIGYEALTRGPAGTEYENPYVLFDAATETELVFELDSLCRKKTFQNAKGIPNGIKLFINCMPSAILDPKFKDSSIEYILKGLNIPPQNLVIEVTEREAIENYDLFKEAIEHYANIGLSIAVDDTGSGYSSLETVVELRPHYIKLDMSIVRGINKNMLKQELIKAIHGLASKMGSLIIAEGIETKEELETIREIGINIGQGFLFAKPGEAFPSI